MVGWKLFLKVLSSFSYRPYAFGFRDFICFLLFSFWFILLRRVVRRFYNCAGFVFTFGQNLSGRGVIWIRIARRRFGSFTLIWTSFLNLPLLGVEWDRMEKFVNEKKNENPERKTGKKVKKKKKYVERKYKREKFWISREWKLKYEDFNKFVSKIENDKFRPSHDPKKLEKR